MYIHFSSKAQGADKVILAEGNEDLVIRDSPRSISLAVDHTYTISCAGEWFQNGLTVPGSDSLLRFDPFSGDLTGNYTCQFTGGGTFDLNISAGIYICIIIHSHTCMSVIHVHVCLL